MKGIEVFSATAVGGFMSTGEIDIPKLKNEVNTFLNRADIKVLDVQYRMQPSGVILVVHVMVYYESETPIV